MKLSSELTFSVLVNNTPSLPLVMILPQFPVYDTLSLPLFMILPQFPVYDTLSLCKPFSCNTGSDHPFKPAETVNRRFVELWYLPYNYGVTYPTTSATQ